MKCLRFSEHFGPNRCFKAILQEQKSKEPFLYRAINRSGAGRAAEFN